jgi:hypothetical protein
VRLAIYGVVWLFEMRYWIIRGIVQFGRALIDVEECYEWEQGIACGCVICICARFCGFMDMSMRISSALDGRGGGKSLVLRGFQKFCPRKARV